MNGEGLIQEQLWEKVKVNECHQIYYVRSQITTTTTTTKGMFSTKKGSVLDVFAAEFYQNFKEELNAYQTVPQNRKKEREREY